MTLYEAVHTWLLRRVDEIAPTSFDKEARLAGWLIETEYADRSLSELTGDDVERMRELISGATGRGGGRGKGSVDIALRLFVSIIEEYRDSEAGDIRDPWLEGIRRLPIERPAALGMAAMLNRGIPLKDVAERYGATTKQVTAAVRTLRYEIEAAA